MDLREPGELGLLLPDRRLGVLKGLKTLLSGVTILHLVDGLLDQAEQVVDIRYLHKVSLDAIEVHVGVEQLDKQVEVLGLTHADICCLEGLSQLVHSSLAILSERAPEEVRVLDDRLALHVLLEELSRVGHGVGAESLEVVSTESSDVVQGGHHQVEGGNFLLSLADVFFEDGEGLSHELVCEIFKVHLQGQVVDSHH